MWLTLPPKPFPQDWPTGELKYSPKYLRAVFSKHVYTAASGAAAQTLTWAVRVQLGPGAHTRLVGVHLTLPRLAFAVTFRSGWLHSC